MSDSLKKCPKYAFGDTFNKSVHLRNKYASIVLINNLGSET